MQLSGPVLRPCWGGVEKYCPLVSGPGMPSVSGPRIPSVSGVQSHSFRLPSLHSLRSLRRLRSPHSSATLGPVLYPFRRRLLLSGIRCGYLIHPPGGYLIQPLLRILYQLFWVFHQLSSRVVYPVCFAGTGSPVVGFRPPRIFHQPDCLAGYLLRKTNSNLKNGARSAPESLLDKH